MDLADYYAREANDETEMLKLLYLTHPSHCRMSIFEDRLMRCIYELRTITVIQGVMPQVMECIMCGDRERKMESVPVYGGIRCDLHAGWPYFRWNPAASVDIICTALHRVFSG